MKSFSDIRMNIMLGKTDINMLGNEKEIYKNMADNSNKFRNDDEFKSFLMLCLDYYTYSDKGDTLISDTEYDRLMQIWCKYNNPPLVYPDSILNYKTWNFVRHTMPGLVGTVKKIYSEEDLAKYLKKNIGIKRIILAPKYDGISVVIEVRNGLIYQAITRADGVEGQDITELVKGASNAVYFAKDNSGTPRDGHYKCELVTSTDHFLKLVNEKDYSNRRSATSGLVNTPKNVRYAKYLTIIPLMYKKDDIIKYYPVLMEELEDPGDIEHIMKKIHKMLSVIRAAEFPYRVDGVVLCPVGYNVKYNDADYMDQAIAFKINTAEAPTTIDFGYVSLGRKGNAIPMLKVHPVEVNETRVSDVSLGSFDKFMRMGLREGETVIVYSAGDVIPQIKLPEERIYPKKANYIEIEKRCPYCNEKLERFGGIYKCINGRCERIITGVITNFLDVLGAENFSDATVEAFYHAKILRDIRDLFDLAYDDIIKVDGFKDTSTNNILKELERIKTNPITISKLFGSLGIPNIAEKKCRKIFSEVDAEYVLEKSKDNIMHRLLNCDGIGMETIESFVTYVKDNKSLIRFLLDNMNIVKEVSFKGNIVFTGFRNPEYEKRFNKLGYEVVDTVNSKTIAVISASGDRTSGKCKSAMKKNISIVNVMDIDEVFDALENPRVENQY